MTRQWASYLAVPVWVWSREGDLLYYNEAAEALIGRRYDEAGEMPLVELSTILKITDADGSPLAPEELPGAVALSEQRPAHRHVRFKGFDGVSRSIEVTAFPLHGQGGRQLGAVTFFWEASSE